MQGKGIALRGCGSASPQVAFHNDQMSRLVDTNDEWIATRTGIRSRKLSGPQDTLSSLATIAARQALDMAHMQPEELDLIILATSTPDDLFGSACEVQAQLGASHAVAFDLTAACSGFIFGLVNAAQFIRTGVYRNVLLIGADLLSRWVDWEDRRTCVLFGDGAGAVVIQADDRDRLKGFAMQSDGQMNAHLKLPFQSDARPLLDEIAVGQGNYKSIAMNGQEVYRFAVRRVPEIVEKALFQANLTVDAIDWLVLHQANQRILDAAAKRLKVPHDKVISNMANFGNTSAASIPLALDAHVRNGQIKPGDVIASAGFGAGLSWGSAIFEWQ